MNSSVWAVWAAQGSKEKKNQFEYFLATSYSTYFTYVNEKICFLSVKTRIVIMQKKQSKKVIQV